MIRFRDFYEQEDSIEDIESDPVFKIKEKFSNTINSALEWIPEADQNFDIQEIKNKVSNLSSELEDINAELEKNIDNKSTLSRYQSIYQRVIENMDQFEDPPADIKALLNNLNKYLQDLYVFVQSAIRVPS
jgi:DNA repair exonuclease SbcCD ATPase subunit